MLESAIAIILLPLVGTSLGAACVFVLKTINSRVEKILNGFASGVMVSAGFFSLLLPALESTSSMGRWAFLPCAIGFWIGILFLMALDKFVPHLHTDSNMTEGISVNFKKTTMMALAVTLHNLPEGMAVGIVLAGWLENSSGITFTGALALAIGIAIQNFPEGAIVSMPLTAEGLSKRKSFLYGVASGAVEPLGALLTVILAHLAMSQIIVIMPYMLSFAAGAMIYVVVEELIPEMITEEHSATGTFFFTAGFTVMLALETVLG